jgi:hypothetical protein
MKFETQLVRELPWHSIGSVHSQPGDASMATQRFPFRFESRAARINGSLVARLIPGIVGFLIGIQAAVAVGDDTPPPSSDGRLLLRGRVLLADGTPAANATVVSIHGLNRGDTTALTDAEGWFELTDVFGFDCRLHVRSHDGMQQLAWRVPALETRTRFAEPVELTLQPADEQSVVVTSQGQPVEGVTVIASGEGTDFRVTAVTAADGRAVLRIPSGGQINWISAWHATLGVDTWGSKEGEPVPETVEFALRPTAPQTIRFVDPAGNPVPDVAFTCGIYFGGDTGRTHWLHSSELEQARLRSGEDGSVTVPWLPAEFKGLNIEELGYDWKFDDDEQADETGGDTIVHIRRQHTIEGRLEMPAGEDASGLLIHGSSFGPGGHMHVPRTRARADGTFSLPVCSDHVYFLSVIDSEWGSDEWTGVILATDDAEPVDVVIPVYRAAPVEIRVTRGPGDRPLSDTYVLFEREQDAEWRDASGEQRGGVNGVQGWMKTDADGIARCALGQGVYNIQLYGGDFHETQRLHVTNSSPQLVLFHRPWDDQRTVTGQLTRDGEAFVPTQNTRLFTWGINPDGFDRPEATERAIAADGTLTASYDAEEIGVFAYDPELNISGFFVFSPEAEEAPIELHESGTYSGQLLDVHQHPVPGVDIILQPATSRVVKVPSGEGFSFDVVHGPDLDVMETATTDAEGRFRLVNVPTEVPVQFRLVDSNGLTGYISRHDSILLTPGENRENGIVTFHYQDDALEGETAAATPKPLAERLARTLSFVDAGGMHLLVLLQGDASSHVLVLTERCIDYEENENVYKYLPLILTPEDQQRDAEVLARHGWPSPQPGEVVLLVLDAGGNVLGSERLDAHDEVVANESVALAGEFIARHVPPMRNAHRVFGEAKELAAETDRRIWVVYGGPRCYPCFLLGRWLQEQHELIEQDYVVVKFGICDEFADEVMRPYGPVPSIPWFVILDAEGNKLITSDGPLGNIGFPSEIESGRYFREMLDATSRRLTDEEKTRLVDSVQVPE